MKYQLVLQFPASAIKDYDGMMEIENLIICGLGSLGEVDGHDAGSGETNIFVHTDNPQFAFARIWSLLCATDFASKVKAAYREIGGEVYTIIHPPGLGSFSVK